MAQRTGTTYSQIEAQSFRPVLIQTISFTTSAALSALIPFTKDNGPSGGQEPLAGDYGRRGGLLVLQADADVFVRLVGAGTVAAAQTVTYSSSAGAQTVVIQGVTLSFTAGASDTLTAVACVAALRANALLSTIMQADNAAGVVTFTMKKAYWGAGFNALTLTVTGTGATAGSSTFASGTGPSAGTTATNAILLPAKSLLPMYRFPADVQIDVKGSSGSGNLQVFAGY
jgi:hypothetical protein